MKVLLAVLVLMLVMGGCLAQGVVVKRVLRIDPSLQRQLIHNGDLEILDDVGLEGWQPWELGYEVDAETRHGGQFSARCHNETPQEHRGMTYTVTLNQEVATPIVAECWSKAEEVSGSPDSDYSLYLDLEYMDGTPLWGQIATFKTGTHDWEKRTVTVIPAKPVRRVQVHGIFRRHAGTAWFDDFRLWEYRLPGGVKQFDSVPVTSEGTSPCTYLRGPLDHEVALLVRDVAGKSDFVQVGTIAQQQADGAMLVEGTDETLKLGLSFTLRQTGAAMRVDGTVRDLSGTDRAVTVYCVTPPIHAEGWRWHDDQRVSRAITAGQTYANAVSVPAGANRQAARFPLACISSDTAALAIGAPLDVPRLYRFAYDADSQELYGAVDLGLAPDTRNFPSSASFSFVLYRCDPEWGYRAALQRYYELFPHCFTKRNQREGIWMPFVDIATVAGFEDFGFQFQEGAPNVAFDEEHGIYSFVYVEPMSHWLAMPPEMERTNERAMQLIREQAAAGNRQSQATLTSALEDADGNWIGGITKAPWCDGALYLLNPSPFVAADSPQVATKFRNDWAHIESVARNPGGVVSGWGAYGGGYELAPGEGRNGSTAAIVQRTADQADGGISQRVLLNQTEPRPIIARAWTRAASVTGDPDNNYSLYVDLTYTDGTPLWGQIAAASGGTHDWELLERRIVPAKPVQALTFHLLLRAPRTGTVWFDDAFLAEEGSEENLLKNADFEPASAPSGARPFLDGTYFDSFEMASTTLNYRREHFFATETPLVFDSEGRLCQLTVFNTTEYVREVARRMWASGRMTFANATPWSFPWGAPWLDVMGTETNWAPGSTFTTEGGWSGDSTWTPESDAIMCYRRAVCYQRPYLLLQNTVFEAFKPEWVELYMKRCCAYAVFPSFFSHNAADAVYWNRPNLYERDRPLFRKYIPVIKALSAAGWEPITLAHADNPRVYVERFGGPGGSLFFTVFNDSREPVTATVSLQPEALGPTDTEPRLVEVLSGAVVPTTAAGPARRVLLRLEPEDVKVLRVE